MYINTQQISNSNGLYARKSYISNNFKVAISEYKGVLHCEVCDYEHMNKILRILVTPYLIPLLQEKWNC